MVRTVLGLAVLTACGSRSHSRGGTGDGDVDADADADGSEGGPDAAAGADSGAESCAAPRAYCDAPAPSCPLGEYPAVSPERCGFGTDCQSRCWTGDCRACADDCRIDQDCALAGRWGCCDFSGGGICRWVSTAAALARDPCLFDVRLPIPEVPPAGCSDVCFEGPECLECPHCGPHDVRCEGGRCVEVYSYCQPAGCLGCQ